MHELLGCSYLWGCFVYRKEYKTKDSRSTLWLDLRQIKGKVIHSSQFGNYEKKIFKKRLHSIHKVIKSMFSGKKVKKIKIKYLEFSVEDAFEKENNINYHEKCDSCIFPPRLAHHGRKRHIEMG